MHLTRRRRRSFSIHAKYTELNHFQRVGMRRRQKFEMFSVRKLHFSKDILTESRQKKMKIYFIAVVFFLILYIHIVGR